VFSNIWSTLPDSEKLSGGRFVFVASKGKPRKPIAPMGND
jgi:hypothetical protein